MEQASREGATGSRKDNQEELLGESNQEELDKGTDEKT